MIDIPVMFMYMMMATFILAGLTMISWVRDSSIFFLFFMGLTGLFIALVMGLGNQIF
jgi:hypothetical protein